MYSKSKYEDIPIKIQYYCIYCYNYMVMNKLNIYNYHILHIVCVCMFPNCTAVMSGTLSQYSLLCIPHHTEPRGHVQYTHPASQIPSNKILLTRKHSHKHEIAYCPHVRAVSSVQYESRKHALCSVCKRTH